MTPPRPAAATGRSTIVATLAVTALAVTGFALYVAGERGDAPRHATVLPQGQPLPDFALVDEAGAVHDRRSLEGHWSLLFFGFTHCPDVCPVTLGQLAMVGRQLGRARPAIPPPEILFISVDPDRDTPDVVRAYLEPFDGRITGLTGDPGQLAVLADGLGIYYAKRASADAADYSMDHTAAVLLVDPRAELRAIFGAPHDVADLVHDIALIEDGA